MSWFEFIVAHDLVLGVLVAVIVGTGAALVAALAVIRRAGRPSRPVPPFPRP